MSTGYKISYMHEKSNRDYAEIATITFLDTGCLMFIVYCFLFGQRSICVAGGQGLAKFFDWRGTAPMPPGFIAVGWTRFVGDIH